MRGANNSRKTSCPEGHEYDRVNILRNGSKTRYCSICKEKRRVKRPQAAALPLESITKEMVDSKYRYDSITGAFSFANPHPYMPTQNPGTVRSTGYLMLNLCGRQCSAHRLAFLAMTGKWPENHVDHIDGNRLNNAWANLRDVTRQTNNENVRKARKDSHTGYIGARKRLNGTFYAAIKVNRKDIWLGNFKTAEEAHHAYLKAKRQYHKGCTI